MRDDGTRKHHHSHSVEEEEVGEGREGHKE